MKQWLVILLAGIVTVMSFPVSADANHQKTRVEVNIWLHGAPDIQPIKDLESLVGVKFNGAKWYENWDDPWRPHIPNGYHANGYIPEMTWQPMLKQPDGSFKGVANDDIVAGAYDSYLDTMSAQVKSLPYRLRIAFAAEFNGDWNPWGLGKVGNTTENHKTSWRHIVNRFKANGVTNVDWIWTPNVDPFNMTPSYASMYPGNEYVTYFGLDGYNFSTTNGPYWMSFDQVFQSSYNQLQAIAQKDVYLIEVGSVEVDGDKAAWIKDMFEKLETGYSRIKGITWWNVAYTQYDMRIQSSEASRLQFAASVNGTPAAPVAPPASNPGAAPGKTTQKTTPPPKTEDPAVPTALPDPADQGFSLPSIVRQLTPDRSTTVVGAAALILFALTAIFYAVVHTALREPKNTPPKP